MENKANYYAIIPASIRYNKNINNGAKLLYGEITALSGKEGYCWATNAYFANLYETSTRTIQRWLSDLVEEKVIIVELIYRKDSKEVEQRRIYINDTPKQKEVITSGDKNVITSSDKDVTTANDKDVVPPNDENVMAPDDVNVVDNNININTINNNNIKINTMNDNNTTTTTILKNNTIIDKDTKENVVVVNDIENDIEKVKAIFTNHEIADIQAKKILIAAKNDFHQIDKVYKHFKDKDCENFLGLMIEMVKPDKFYDPVKNVSSSSNNKRYNKEVNTFGNYSNQGEYDHDYIEKKLLGWD